MDLKIKDVAELLSVSETTVRRWLVDGKIPAYRLNKQYRFSRVEIEDWLMQQKLGLSVEDKNKQQHQLQDEEKPTLSPGSMQFGLYRALYHGEVIIDLEAKDKEDLIKQVMQRLCHRFDCDPDVLSDLFLDREHLMSTSLGSGVAIPHTRDFLLNTHYDLVTLVFSKTPIEYGALDGQPVDLFFFLFASEDKNHLHLLAKIAHFVSNEKTKAFLRTQPLKTQLLDFIKQWEGSLGKSSLGEGHLV